ncbi:MAG: ABC transporter permease [Hahellaceae bacterium]|nr:ABC transporter permease [Hahellaceae bacterium]
MFESLKTTNREIKAYSNVLNQLVRQQLILRYRRTVLGYLWTLINPLLMMIVMAFVFSSLFHAELETFAVFLFSAMIPWNCFSAVVSQSAGSFINNESLIKKIYLPKLIFPLSVAWALLIDSFFSFIALFALIMLIGGKLSWALLFLPSAYMLLFIFSLGCGLIVSVATVFFRDLQYVIAIALQGLFFLSPILYKSDAIKGKVAWLVQLNPLVPFIELFRAPLFESSLPSPSIVMSSIAVALVTLVIGFIVFKRAENNIVFRL